MEKSITAAVMVTMDVSDLPTEAMPALVAALRSQLLDHVRELFATERVALLVPSDVETWTVPDGQPR